MKNLLTHWDAMRILRLALGIIIIVQGVGNGEVLYLILGGMLALLALAGVGCCGTRGCAIDTRQGKNKEEKEIVYEEVDGTK